MTASAILTGDDVTAMVKLHRAAFPASEAWSVSAFSDMMRQSTTHAEGIFAHAELQTMLLVQYVAGEAEILTLATAPGARRRGLAQQTLDGMQQRLAPLGLAKWLLDVAEDNRAARAFYKKLGFQVDARRANYYKRLEGTSVDAILMSKPVGGQITK